MIDLSVIIISYNTKKLLQNCIRSIKQNEPKGLVYEVIVVDNGSTDGTVEAIANFKFLPCRQAGQISYFRLIINRENLGFARANNQSMQVARGKFILLLNSDTEVLDNALATMVEFMRKHKDAGVVGGKLLNPDGTSQPSTGQFLGLWQTMLWLFGGERVGLLRSSPNEVTETDWVSGAFFMVRRKVLKRVGLLDEHFFMYLEEMELCYRIQKAGFSIYFLPSARVSHIGLGSGNRTAAILNIYKGISYFYKKHKNPPELLIVKFLLKTKAVIAITAGIILNNTYLRTTYTKALSLSL